MKFFSILDVSSAFLCIKLEDHLESYFGVQFENIFFVFQSLPFGVHNSMNLFLRAMHFTLSKVRSFLPSNVTIASYRMIFALLAIHNHPISRPRTSFSQLYNKIDGQ